MSKVGFFLRGARGTVGDVTLKKGQNGTIMSVKADKVRNPKTPKQSAQRIIFTLIAYATTFLKPLVNHSFEGKNGTNENLQEFRRLNLERFRALSAMQYAYDQDTSHDPDSWVNACYTIKSIKTLIPNSYIVSQGSLNYHGALSVFTEDSATMYLKVEGGDITSKVVVSDNKVYMTAESILDTLLGISKLNSQFTIVGIAISNEVLFKPSNDSQGLHTIKRGGRLVRRIVISNAANLSTLIQVASLEGGVLTMVDSATITSAIEGVLEVSKTDVSLLGDIFDNFTLLYNSSTQTYSLSSSEFTISTPAGYYGIKALGIIISELEGNTWRYNNCTLTTISETPLDNFEYGLPWNLANQYWERAYVNAPAASFLDTGVENTTNLDA